MIQDCNISVFGLELLQSQPQIVLGLQPNPRMFRVLGFTKSVLITFNIQ